MSSTNKKKPDFSCYLCQEPDNEQMIAYDVCENYYHFKCVGVDEQIANVPWSCTTCEDREKTVKTVTPNPTNSKNATPANTAAKEPTVKQLKQELTLFRSKYQTAQLRSDNVQIEVNALTQVRKDCRPAKCRQKYLFNLCYFNLFYQKRNVSTQNSNLNLKAFEKKSELQKQNSRANAREI